MFEKRFSAASSICNTVKKKIHFRDYSDRSRASHTWQRSSGGSDFGRWSSGRCGAFRTLRVSAASSVYAICFRISARTILPTKLRNNKWRWTGS